MRTIGNWIGGQPVAADEDDRMELVDPSTGAVFATAPRSRSDQVDRACRAAAAAFPSWRETTPAERSRALLRIAEPFYAETMACRNRLYDLNWKKIHRLPVPIISLGNLTAGGTGKTPLVRFLADAFRSLNFSPAILMRGYKPKHADRSDEEQMLRDQLFDGLMTQLRSIPVGFRVDSWIMREHAEVASLQREMVLRQLKDNLAALGPGSDLVGGADGASVRAGGFLYAAAEFDHRVLNDRLEEALAQVDRILGTASEPPQPRG